MSQMFRPHPPAKGKTGIIMEDKLKILLCEDDENLGMLLREYLAAKG